MKKSNQEINQALDETIDRFEAAAVIVIPVIVVEGEPHYTPILVRGMDTPSAERIILQAAELTRRTIQQRQHTKTPTERDEVEITPGFSRQSLPSA